MQRLPVVRNLSMGNVPREGARQLQNTRGFRGHDEKRENPALMDRPGP